MEEKGLEGNLNNNYNYSKKKRIFVITIISVVVILVAVGIFLVLHSKKIGISEQCSFACETNQTSGFCDFKRNVQNNITATCNELAINSQYSKYNVQACPTISCETPQEVDRTCVSGFNSEWTTPNADGTCPIQENKFIKKLNPSDSPPVEGQICCYYYPL